MNFYNSSCKLTNRWFKSIDILNLSLLLLLMVLGILFVSTASPNVAKSKSLVEFYFIKKHCIFVLLSMFSMIFFSFFSEKGIINISYLGLFLSLSLLILLFLINNENNGASRWLKLSKLSIQPSEFLKPFLIIMFAYLLNTSKKFNIFNYKIEGTGLAFLLLFLISVLMLAQPNFSMFALIFLVFLAQYFTIGINLKFCALVFISISILTVLAYTNLSHVRYRIDSFLNPNSTHFQVEKSLEAYKAGGFLGKGPGEGEIKKYIPDSHTDFIVPVIAEEYGGIVCILLVLIILCIYLRGIFLLDKNKNKFKITSCVGLLTLFIIQAFINISVSIKLIPTTGVTFPFISYGGSSLVSMGIVMGMVLALTKKEFSEKGLIYE